MWKAQLSGLHEFLQYRELLKNLVIRDLRLRYRNSAFGFLWCLFNPLLMMLVFTVLFTVLLRNNTIEKFPVFILIGLLAWNLHTTALMGATNSIVANGHLIHKVYFPREILPISVVLSNTANFVLALIALFLMLLVFQIPLTSYILFLPVVLLFQVLFITGVGLILSALNVYYRDVGIIMETVILAWFFLTPVFYRIEDVFPFYSRLMYIVNPPASFIAAYRDILYYGVLTNFDFLLRTFVTCVVVFIAGYIIFQRASRGFAEAL